MIIASRWIVCQRDSIQKSVLMMSSANPKNVLKNIQYVNEPMDEELVKKVQEIIGDQMFVRWKNS